MRWLLCGALALLGCGADEAAPAPAQVVTPVSCPPLRSLAPRTLALLDEGRLPGLRALFAERVDDAQLSAVIDALLRLLRALSADDIEALFGLLDHPAVGELSPLLDDLLRWVAGAPDGSGYQAALVGELRRLVGVCDTAEMLSVVRAAAEAPELSSLLGGLGEVLALDLVQQVLGAGAALDRDGFTVLVCNILASVIRPGFSVEAAIITPLSGIDVLPLSEPPIAPFLRDLDAVLDPEGALLPGFADLVCCDVYGVRRCSALPADAVPLARDPVFTWALHALFSGGVIDIEAALGALGRVVADPSIGEALAPVEVVIDSLVADAELKATLDRLLLLVLEPETARRVLQEVLLLVDAGSLSELRAVVDAVVLGCDAERFREASL